jgi:hypothetical protein
MSLLTLNSVQAGFYGRLDSRVQAGNRLIDENGFIEEYADFRFVDQQSGVESGVSFALRQGDNNEENLYQLYFEKQLDGLVKSYRIGRMERYDSLGMYTLDGALIKAKNDNVLLNLYAGQPYRVDDYSAIHGDALYGFDLHFSDLNIPALFSSLYFDNTVSRFGLQQIKDKAEHETRLNLGFTGNGKIHNSGSYDFGIDLNATYLLNEEYAEQVQLKVYSDITEADRVQFDYETFTLTEPALSFTQQFYSVYALGRQSALTGSYYFNQNASTQWIAKARTVLREYGKRGYGLSLASQMHEYTGEEYQLQMDYLQLDQDEFISLYANSNHSFSSLVKSRFGAAIQSQHKWLTGTNQAVGVEANVERMLGSGLYFTFSMSSIWNTHLHDEYQFGLKLSYQFDESNKWWSDE